MVNGSEQLLYVKCVAQLVHQPGCEWGTPVREEVAGSPACKKKCIKACATLALFMLWRGKASGYLVA